MTKLAEEIDKLLLSYLDGTISAEGIAYLQEWCSQDNNLAQLQDLHEVYVASLTTNPDTQYDNEKAWTTFSQQQLNISPRKHYGMVVQWLKIAAVFLLIFAGGLFTFRYSKREVVPQKLAYSEFKVPRGSRSHIFLPDGTSVWLNAESSLSFSQNFNLKQREVALTGEAFFEVVRNEKLPFVVRAKSTTVKVLGTVFNVKAYPEENFVETTVVKGRVQVFSTSKGNLQKHIILTANQRVKISSRGLSENTASIKKDSINDTIEKEYQIPENKFDFSPNIATEVYTSWKDSLWIIESEKLKDLAIKIERRYNVRVNFKDTELESFVFSGKLQDETLDQVLQAISVAAPVKYKVINDNIILSRH